MSHGTSVATQIFSTQTALSFHLLKDKSHRRDNVPCFYRLQTKRVAISNVMSKRLPQYERQSVKSSMSQFTCTCTDLRLRACHYRQSNLKDLAVVVGPIISEIVHTVAQVEFFRHVVIKSLIFVNAAG